MGINRRKQLGFTLVEVLVSLLIGAVGILGVATVQLTSLKGVNHSFFRSQASLFSYEIIGYMRANRDAAVNQDYNIALVNASDVENPGGSASIANKEKFRWFNKINNMLPNAQASIACDALAACQIQVHWSSRIEQNSSNITLVAQL